MLGELNVIGTEHAQGAKVIVREIGLSNHQRGSMVSVSECLCTRDQMRQTSGGLNRRGTVRGVAVPVAGVVKRLLQETSITESVELGVLVCVQDRPIRIADVQEAGTPGSQARRRIVSGIWSQRQYRLTASAGDMTRADDGSGSNLAARLLVGLLSTLKLTNASSFFGAVADLVTSRKR